MEIGDPVEPPSEAYLGTSVRPASAPAELLAEHGEGRLHPLLREVAQRQDPGEALTMAALAFAHAQRPDGPAPWPGDPARWAAAFADLSVSGRAAYEALARAPIDDAQLVARLKARAHKDATESELAAAAGAALDRAYTVAWALRGPPSERAEARRTLAERRAPWIAVSGEDDPPHRPVNTAALPCPSHELGVRWSAELTIGARFALATVGAAPPVELPQPRPRRGLPADATPRFDPELPLLLFLPSMGESAEELAPLLPALDAAARAEKVAYQVVLLDLPGSGYGAPPDDESVATAAATWFPAEPGDKRLVLAPLHDFYDDFVAAFVDELDRRFGVAGRLRALCGGSLGGNLALRLGSRDARDYPWLGNIVAWSPASTWPPNCRDLVKALGPRRCLQAMAVPETDATRAAFFAEVFDRPMIPLLQPQSNADMWFRDDWPGKPDALAAARLGAQERYSRSFRRWHWRLAAEALAFSHIDNIAPPGRPRCLWNRSRTLLLAGERDNFKTLGLFTTKAFDLYDDVRAVARQMGDTPGRALFLRNTGHSIHLERPRFLAATIVRFLGR